IIRFPRVALAAHDVRWPMQFRGQLHVITPIKTELAKRCGREICKTISRSGCDHEVVRFRLLQDAPHRLDIFRRPSPISLDREVTELNSVLPARSNATGGTNDLLRDKRLRPARRFVVEQDPIGSKQTIGLAIVDHRPMCGCLSQGVRTARVKWGLFRCSLSSGIAETLA